MKKPSFSVSLVDITIKNTTLRYIIFFFVSATEFPSPAAIAHTLNDYYIWGGESRHYYKKTKARVSLLPATTLRIFLHPQRSHDS